MVIFLTPTCHLGSEAEVPFHLQRRITNLSGIVMFLEIKIIKEQEEVFDMMEHKVKNAKVGEKRRLVFSVHGMIEKKENGIWEKDNAEVQFLGGSAVFAARSIVKLRQLFAQQKMKDALLVIVQVGLLVATGDK